MFVINIDSILNSVDIDIKLWPCRDEFQLITNHDGLECKITIEDISLNVCKVAVSPLVMMAMLLVHKLLMVNTLSKEQISEHSILLNILMGILYKIYGMGKYPVD